MNKILSTLTGLLAASLCLAENPFIQTIYTADPAPVVRDGVCYVYTSHDEDVSVNNFFTMKDWRCFSTTDMVNWTDHGKVASLYDFKWAESGWGGGFENGAWAVQCIERDGKWYLYCPMHGRGIGVLVADSPFGPFKDPIGKPLVAGDHIDPTVFIDDDEQAYLCWGNPKCWYAKLNKDMISFDTSIGENGIVAYDMSVEAFGERSKADEKRPTSYEEGPWIYERGSLYYLFYPGGPLPEHLGYSTGKSPIGPWEYGGVVMKPQSAFTNHPGVVDFKGKTYLFYHNADLPGGGGFKRSVCVDELSFNADGSVPEVTPTKQGPAQADYLNPYKSVEAETICLAGGVETRPCSEGGIEVYDIDGGDYIKVKGVDFGSGASVFEARVASENGGTIELRLGSVSGRQVGACLVPPASGERKWQDVSCDVDGASGLHDLYLVFAGEKNDMFSFNRWKFGKSLVLTPPAPETPRINGASIFGVRPDAPFIYSIPATGNRPIRFSVTDLPRGLAVNSETGRITGTVSERGEYVVTLRAENALGSDAKQFRIVVGDKIALTPPMGWSSWNCWGDAVSQEKVLSSARAMVQKGLSQYGWTYINIDDGWQAKRGGKYNAIQPNKKFPDMKALGDEIHELGLKFGIYSGPWRGTYAGYAGGSSDNADGTYDWIESGYINDFYKLKTPDNKPAWVNWTFGKHSFAVQDAKQWADWGIDYLKYDWFPNDVPTTREMSEALRGTGRDIVYSLSNTGIYDNAAEYVELANLWRTTGDINDSWRSASHGFQQDRWAGFTGPGHWSDPDMLVVGMVGWGPNLHKTNLTSDEQYSHISLWCLLSAPLLLGCDIAQMDDFTLSLLTNNEVLAINQDVLGKQATQISNDGERVVYAKTLEDGSYAVGLFNRGDAEETVGLRWGPWGTLATPDGGAQFTVRDLWRQKDLGRFRGRFEAKVAPHGVVLVRLIPAK
jgi:alpha-galactosidase